MKWFKDVVTGLDGETHDIARWSWLVSLITAVGVTIHTACVKGSADVVAFAQAIAAISAAHGASLWAKKDTEPK